MLVYDAGEGNNLGITPEDYEYFKGKSSTGNTSD